MTEPSHLTGLHRWVPSVQPASRAGYCRLCKCDWNKANEKTECPGPAVQTGAIPSWAR